MTLATPINASIPDDVINGLLTIHGAWLNGVARPLPKWTFTNGKTVIMSGGTGTDCGTMFSRYNWRGSDRVDYFFRPRPCYEPNKFICRKDNCSPLARHCIIHDSSMRLNWFDARDYCLQRKADLFYLNQDESSDNMAMTFSWTYHDMGNIFVGLRKRAWVWVVDSEEGEKYLDMKKTHWKSNEPNRAYKNCIKQQYTGTWDDQECSQSGPFPLCTRDAVPLEDLNAESTTEYMTTPLDEEFVEKSTTQRKIETTPTEIPTTTIETTTFNDNQFGKKIVPITTQGTTYQTPTNNEDNYNMIATTLLPDLVPETTDIPKSTAKQTTILPTTTGGIFQEGEKESTRIPDSTSNPKDKSLLNSETTTPELHEEPKTEKPTVKVVTVREVPVPAISTRGLSSTTTPPGVDYKSEKRDNKETLKTLTKLVLYKFMANSAPTVTPYLSCFVITFVIFFKDLLN